MAALWHSRRPAPGREESTIKAAVNSLWRRCLPKGCCRRPLSLRAKPFQPFDDAERAAAACPFRAFARRQHNHAIDALLPFAVLARAIARQQMQTVAVHRSGNFCCHAMPTVSSTRYSTFATKECDVPFDSSRLGAVHTLRWLRHCTISEACGARARLSAAKRRVHVARARRFRSADTKVR